jgi:hypothetical protein
MARGCLFAQDHNMLTTKGHHRTLLLSFEAYHWWSFQGAINSTVTNAKSICIVVNIELLNLSDYSFP